MTSSEGNIEDDKKVDILLQRDQTISEVSCEDVAYMYILVAVSSILHTIVIPD